MPPRIIPLSARLPYLNLMIYGDSGCGKTVFGGSDDKVLFVAPENDGVLSALMQGSNAEMYPIANFEDIRKAHRYLRNMGERRGKLPWNWITFDSATEMQEMLRLHLLEEGLKLDDKRDEDVLQWEDYLKFYAITKKMIKGFNSLPINCLYTALVDQETDAEGEEYYTPSIQGRKQNLSQTIASYMTSYGYMQTKIKKIQVDGKSTSKEVRRITWRDVGAIKGKDRTDSLKPYTEDLTLQQIREKIEANIKKIQAKTAAKPAIKRPVESVSRTTEKPAEQPAEAAKEEGEAVNGS